MSLQPGINPLEAAAERFRSAVKFRENMAQGIPNVPGQHYSFPSAEELKRRTKTTTTKGRDNFNYNDVDTNRDGIRTLEYVPGRDKSERRTLEYIPGRDKSTPQLLDGSNLTGAVYGPGPGERDRQRVAERTRAAMEFRHNMAQGIPAAPGMGPGMARTAGFDASDLMKDPEMAQKSTRDQAEKVSEPYRQANMMAAEKTNPMNAASQNPGKEFLQDYIIEGPNFSTFKDPGERILIPRRK